MTLESIAMWAAVAGASIVVIGVIYTVGRASQRLDSLIKALEAVTTALTHHEDQSVIRIENINERITRLEIKAGEVD